MLIPLSVRLAAYAGSLLLGALGIASALYMLDGFALVCSMVPLMVGVVGICGEVS